jgi:hypothetical protein
MTQHAGTVSDRGPTATAIRALQTRHVGVHMPCMPLTEGIA